MTIQSLANRLVDASMPYIKGEGQWPITPLSFGLAAESDWNKKALLTSFYQGLPKDIKDELASQEQQDDFDLI